ncbi:unnamed protein product [Somion occarium]|uniref:Protein kinase domain-containing protein n=1 Tax=Somion occarium TaxID=3059160 RepID=A0ABP1CWG5_9APHY
MIQMSSILPTFVGHILTSGNLRYRLLESVGFGAYGVVYLALDLNSPEEKPQLYAIKCLLRHPDDSELARNQEREINLHCMVSPHPNVVTLHHVIVEEHYVFLVMDYCSGGDLFGAIMDRGRYINNDAAVKKTFLQLIDAVEACHKQGIYHRDLKPENVLCSADDDQIYLADFGLASQTEVSNTFGCGSSFYMSPECLGIITWKAPYFPRNSDVWSLGVILSNMLTGRNPWHVASADDHGFGEFLRNGAPFLRRALPISRSASHLLTRTFDPDPDVRYTLQELRMGIINIDTFFLPQKALDVPSIPPMIVVKHPHVDTPMEDATLATASVASGVPPTLRVDIVAAPFADECGNASPVDIIDEFAEPPPLSSSRSASPVESDGPATPVSVVHNPHIADLPDLALGVRQGMSKSRGLFSRHTLSLTSSRTKLHKGVQRFVDAVHRVKIMS